MKKSIAIIVLIALILQLFGILVFASPDIDSKDFDRLTKKLTSLGLISSNTLEADDLVTRGEFVSAAAYLFNIDVKNGEQIFADVDNTNPAFGAVYAAYKTGVISLPDDKCFNPNANIKYAEAAKILVSMLGYSEKAIAMGGYPTGYLTLANNLKIGLNSYRDGISYYDMLVAFENMSEIKIPVMNSIETDSVKYETQEGYTLLSEYHNIYLENGIVEGVGVSHIYGKDNLSSDRTQISGTEYFYNYADMHEFIGCEVDYYYTKVGNIKTVVYAELSDERDVLDIPAEDIIDFKDGVYTYYRENGKEDTANVVSVPFVMYNGKTASGKNKNMYEPVSGSVRLVKSKSSSAYDVVIIKEYKTYVVEAVDAKNSIIYGKYGTEKELCFDESKDIDAKITTPLGKDVFTGVIGEWSIVSALVSEDEKYVRAIVSTASVAGTIESLSGSGESQKIEIGGVEYSVSKSLVARNGKIPNLGTEVVCYFDFEGNIAAIADKESLGYNYYVLLQYDYDKKSGLSQNVIIKVLNSANEVEEFNLSEKTKIDAKSYKTAKEQYDAIDEGFKKGRIIRIKLVDGVVYDIDTPNVSDKESEASSLYVYMEKTDGLRYKNSGNIADTFYITDNTFVVFEYPSETNIEERFFVADRKRIGNDTAPDVTAYAIGDTFTPQAVMVIPEGGGSNDVSSGVLYVVKEKCKALDENGENVNKLVIINGASQHTLYVEDGHIAKVGGIDVGDIICVDIVKDKYVLGDFISKIYDYDGASLTQEGLTLKSNKTNAVKSLRMGLVYDKIDTYISYTENTDKSKIETANKLVVSLPANIVKISKERDYVIAEAASNNDVKHYKAFSNNCSEIIVRYQYMVPQELIIIER